MDKVGANTMSLDLKINDVERGIYLYVLVLQNDKFYVGITNCPEKRFQKHRSGYFNPPIKSKPDLRTRKDQGKCSAAGATQNSLD